MKFWAVRKVFGTSSGQQHDQDDQRAEDADLVDLTDPAQRRADSARGRRP